MGKLRQRVEEHKTQVSETREDREDIEQWEKNVRLFRSYFMPDMVWQDVRFNHPADWCWGDEPWDYDPTKVHICKRESVTDIGLCREHYEEIVGELDE